MHPTPDSLNAAVEKALDFLRAHQKPWGEFAAPRYFHPDLSGEFAEDPSPFPTTFTVHALSYVRDAAVGDLRSRALRFLEDLKLENECWRYPCPGHPIVLDPDVDDTCCVSFALWGQLKPTEHRKQLETLLANRDLGRFKTWIRDASEPNDVDAVVNANVLLYLGSRQETAAAIEWLIDIVERFEEKPSMHYYLDLLALDYALSRAYRAGVTEFQRCRDVILKRVSYRLNYSHTTPLSLGLGLCTLLNFDTVPLQSHPKAVARLIAMQAKDGSWPREAFYRGPEPRFPAMVWWGSEELTTSICLEAIARIL